MLESLMNARSLGFWLDWRFLLHGLLGRQSRQFTQWGIITNSRRQYTFQEPAACTFALTLAVPHSMITTRYCPPQQFNAICAISFTPTLWLCIYFNKHCISSVIFQLVIYAGPNTNSRKVTEYGGNTLGYGSRSVLGTGWPKDLVKVNMQHKITYIQYSYIKHFLSVSCCRLKETL